MEEEVTRKQVKISDQFYQSVEQVYDFGLDMFGHLQAERYNQKIRNYLDTLPEYYTAYPECPHLATKSRKYRNIFLDAHKIIYRVTTERIEVLDIVHSKSSITKIRNVRKIRL